MKKRGRENVTLYHMWRVWRISSQNDTVLNVPSPPHSSAVLSATTFAKSRNFSSSVHSEASSIVIKINQHLLVPAEGR